MLLSLVDFLEVHFLAGTGLISILTKWLVALWHFLRKSELHKKVEESDAGTTRKCIDKKV